MAEVARKDWKAHGIYVLLALAVVGPWLRPGYILTLDMDFTPRLRMPADVTSSYLFHALLHILNLVIPSQLIEKLILFLVLFLSGFGMHRLVRYVQGRPAAFQVFGAYVAGLLYAVNPFTYDRLLAGQYSVLLGYALLPFFVRSLLRFLAAPTVRKSLYAAAWAVGISIISIHTLGLVAVMLLAALAGALYRRRKRGLETKALWRTGLISCAAFVVASSYWLVPLLLGKGATAAEIRGFGAGDQAAFATIGGNAFSKVIHVLQLQGFWAEGHNLYLLPQQQLAIWGVLAVLIWLLVAIGIVQCWRSRQQFLAVVFGASTLAAVILAAGLIDVGRIPLLAGYREPQKFAGLVCLGFCVFVGVGAASVLRYCQAAADSRVAARIAGGLLVLLILVFTPTMYGRTFW